MSSCPVAKAPCCRPYQTRKPYPLARQRCIRVQASAYTQPAQQAIRHAQQEACRQGSMFLAPPHLLQGLLDTEGCIAYSLLTAAGLSPAAAEAVLVDPEMVPSSSSMTGGDLHWAPDARKALQVAAETSQQAGQQAAGTPHLLLGLLDCGNAAVAKALEKAGVLVPELKEQALAAADVCEEPFAASQQQAAGDAQAVLVQQYKQWVAQHGSSPPPPGAWGQARQPPPRTAADDDIYE